MGIGMVPVLTDEVHSLYNCNYSTRMCMSCARQIHIATVIRAFTEYQWTFASRSAQFRAHVKTIDTSTI